MTRLLRLTLCLALAAWAGTVSYAQNSGNETDSLAFVNAQWQVTELEKGAVAMYAQLPMFESMQSICVVKYPAGKFRTNIMHRPGEKAGKPGNIGNEVGAAFALNGGYFHVDRKIPSVYFRDGKKQYGYTHPTELYRVNALMGDCVARARAV